MDTFPDVIRIETAGACNFECIHCPTGLNPNGRGVLRESLFHHILDDFKKHDFIPRVAVLYHGGEPLLNKRLEYYIQTLMRLGVTKTNMNTNLSLMTNDRAKSIIKSGLSSITFSFDGISAKEHNTIRVNSDFYNEVKKLKTFLKIKQELKSATPTIAIGNIVICNEQELNYFFTHNRTFNDDFSPQIAEEFAEELKQQKLDIGSHPAYYWPGMKLPERYQIHSVAEANPDYCDKLFETITILSNGNVVACCYDIVGNEIFGNVKSTSLFDIWASEKYCNFRDNFRQKNYSQMCSECAIVKQKFLVDRN
ncbi:MAG: radical SAM protein [Methylococcales bacterium]|jgi:radical SAM protein with 4Fe4S-binding SPASM domain|nr:radical SAM protein [Methylococcales bacterium]MBT7409514.1 radical SAM protein [Methylococcales bacterium]